ncbi:hypothetical protein O9992_29560 [Vibrio lentus]|nr:hypothetical protein [Vibrio lentus]
MINLFSEGKQKWNFDSTSQKGIDAAVDIIVSSGILAASTFVFSDFFGLVFN